jgi:signal transduction histidine kinase
MPHESPKSKPLPFDGHLGTRVLVRIWFGISVAFFVAVVLVGFYVSYEVRTETAGELVGNAYRETELFIHRLREEMPATADVSLPQFIRNHPELSQGLSALIARHACISYAGLRPVTGSVTLWHRDISVAEGYRIEAQERRKEVPAPSGQSVSQGITGKSFPITSADGINLGTIEIGLSADFLEQAGAHESRNIWLAVSLVGATGLAVILGSGILILRLVSRMRSLDQRIAEESRAAELGEMARRLVHEIRNPLNAISMQTEVIRTRIRRGTPDDLDSAREQLDSIESEVNRLERLANGILEFARSGQEATETRELFDLNKCIAEIVDFVEPELQEKHIHIQVTYRPKARSNLVRASRSQFRQVVLNLIRNATEAMDQDGRISISVQPSGKHDVELEVSDTGSGISQENLPHVFEALYTTKIEGSGLGLTIAKRLIDEAGGSITVASKPGHGTTFRITLPLARGFTLRQSSDPSSS